VDKRTITTPRELDPAALAKKRLKKTHRQSSHSEDGLLRGDIINKLENEAGSSYPAHVALRARSILKARDAALKARNSQLAQQARASVSRAKSTGRQRARRTARVARSAAKTGTDDGGDGEGEPPPHAEPVARNTAASAPSATPISDHDLTDAQHAGLDLFMSALCDLYAKRLLAGARR